MNREIKFRGKSIATGKWLYGSLLISHFKDNKKEKYYITQFKGNYTFDHEVYPESVGQFTGMTDDSGVDVYEGDVLHTTSSSGKEYIGKVLFLHGCWHYEFKPTEYVLLSGCIGDDTAPKPSKVIGNTSDTPELMKR